MLARCSVVTLDRVPGAGHASGGENDVDDENDDDDDASTGRRRRTRRGLGRSTTCGGRLGEGLVVLYDSYVVPKGRVTDYRTEWSGITKDTYVDARRRRLRRRDDNDDDNDDDDDDDDDDPSSSSSSSPVVVSFERCRAEVRRILAPVGGRRVVVVGVSVVRDRSGVATLFSLAVSRLFYPDIPLSQ
jgi:hypothetical protein